VSRPQLKQLLHRQPYAGGCPSSPVENPQM